MKKLLLFLLLGSSLYSYDLNLKVGSSSFVIAETGEYGKENLYTFENFLIGPGYYHKIGPIQLFTFLAYQLPTRVTFEDALGEDPNNQLENKFYYGLKSNLGVAYSLDYKYLRVKPALFFNFEHFYIEGLESKEEFIFSYIGNGASLDIGFTPTELLTLGASGGFSYNYIDLSFRDTDLIYSYCWYIAGVLELRL